MSCVYQFSSVAQSCPTLCDPMNRRTPGLPVHHQLPEFTETHVHQVSDAIQPSHPRPSTSPSALHLSQHQDLFKGVSSSHQVSKYWSFSFSNIMSACRDPRRKLSVPRSLVNCRGPAPADPGYSKQRRRRRGSGNNCLIKR